MGGHWVCNGWLLLSFVLQHGCYQFISVFLLMKTIICSSSSSSATIVAVVTITNTNKKK